MSKKDFSVALKYVEARPRSQRRKGTEARVSGISVVGSGASATDLSLLQANLISVINNFTALKDLFDSMFEKDSDGNIHAKLSLWSSGGITAGGVGSGGSGGGGGISYSRLDSWADYSADKAGYVLSALLGKDLDNRVSALANAGYITASYLAPYALRSEIPSLVGYATESFVTSRGYITASALSGYATQSWVEGKKYLTGITSAMVTTALGYTPYNSANFTKDNLKSTLGISDWALASVKPTYTASEVGALSVNGGDIGGSLNFRNGSSITCANGTVLEMHAGVDTYLRGSSNIYLSAPNVYTQRNVYTYKVLDSGNYSSYALSVNGGTVNGSVYMNGYFRLGNSQPIMVADTDGVYQSALYLSTGNNFLIGYGTSVVGKRRTVLLGNIIEFKSNGGEDNTLVLNADRTATFSSTVSAPSFIGNLTGNAGSATKLATSRTIWGQSFDGTQDITGALTAPAITTSSLTIGGATLTYDSVNEALCINGNLYSLGGITAGGVGNGTSDGGGASYDRLDSWNEYAPDKVLSALLGKQMYDRIGAIEGAGYATEAWVLGQIANTPSFDPSGYATESWVTSQGYITQTALTPYFLTSNFTEANIKSTLGIVDSASFALVNAQGVMEIGKYVDFHTTDEEVATDYSLRIECQGYYRNRVYFPTASGTLALTSDLANYQRLATAINTGNIGSQSVASATKLATPRTIWGQSFDGTQDITGALAAPSITTNSLTIGGATITYDSVNEALCINGNMYALGGITAGGAGISAYTSLEARVARLEQQLNIS